MKKGTVSIKCICQCKQHISRMILFTSFILQCRFLCLKTMGMQWLLQACTGVFSNTCIIIKSRFLLIAICCAFIALTLVHYRLVYKRDKTG